MSKASVDDGIQSRLVAYASRVGGESLIDEQVLTSDDICTKVLENALGSDGEHQVAVLRGVGARWLGYRAAIAATLRVVIHHHVSGPVVQEHVQSRIKQAHLYELPFAARPPMPQCSGNGLRSEHTGDHVDVRCPTTGRTTFSLAVHPHQSAFCLRHRIVARYLGI